MFNFTPDYLQVILAGVIAGTINRVVLLRIDYRQYPGYPHGYLGHVFLGFVASALGAVAVPAIMKPDFAAATFLALAVQQFREIRNIERSNLESLERSELVRRGLDYIEGIARTFEARNYLVMGTAFVTSLAAQVGGLWLALVIALIALLISKYFMSGLVIGDICEVVPAQLSFKGAVLMVDEIGIINVGLKELRDKILQEGLAVKLLPRDGNARSTLHDIGQRNAIAFTAAVILGTKKDVDIRNLLPWPEKPRHRRDGLYIMLLSGYPATYRSSQLTRCWKSARSNLLAGLPYKEQKSR